MSFLNSRALYQLSLQDSHHKYFYLLHKCHDVVLAGVAYHEIIYKPSDSHLSAIYHLVRNAGIVWVDFKTQIA